MCTYVLKIIGHIKYPVRTAPASVVVERNVVCLVKLRVLQLEAVEHLLPLPRGLDLGE